MHPVLLQVDPSQLIRDINVGEIAVSIGSFLVTFIVTVAIGLYLLVPTIRRLLGQTSLDDAVRSLLTSTLRALVWAGAFVVAMTIAGYGAFLSAFAIFGSAIALAVGFAAQDLLGNFVAGIFILYDKPFEVGDWIEWNDNSGRIEDIDLRVSRVRTFDNEQITVPNGELANNAVTNPVAYETLRQKFTFGIGYEDDIDTATDIIIEEAENHDDIMDEPAPSVRLVELGDSSVGLQSRFWIEEPSRADFVKTRGEYVQAVKQRFDEADINIPYPNRTIGGGLELQNIDGIAEPADD